MIIDMYAKKEGGKDVHDYTAIIAEKPVQWSLFFDKNLGIKGWSFEDVNCFSKFVKKANTTVYEDYRFSIST